MYGNTQMKELIRDFVFGMEDGLVSNLGLVLGVYVGGGSPFTVVLAGLASMFAGSFSMAAGSYLSAKSQREVYEHEIKSTKEALEKNPQQCITEMRKVLKSEGLGPKAINNFLPKKSIKHPEFVCNYLVQKKVGVTKFDHPLKNSLTMFGSFFTGSLFPVLPFLFISGIAAVYTAITLTILALFSVGIAKTKFTKRNWIKSGLEIVIVGLGAAVIGYLVGRLIGILG